MSTQEQISKLQGLLERIQKNAGRPRAAAPSAPAPMPFAAPVSAPPAPPAPPPFVAPAPAAPVSSFDQSVDDLLNAAPEASPLPIEVDVPLESVPPVAEVQQPEAEPIPLVSVSNAQPPLPPPVDDAFALESEVSEVRVTTAPREQAAEVTVAAIEAEAEPMGTEELSEDDLVEVTEGTPAPDTTDVDIDFDDTEEQPPASSQRSRVASSMDEALAAAAEQLEAEREVPLKTPPPESGPQEAPPMGMPAPAAPDVDALLGSELDIPTRAEATFSAPGPTPEQLGQTIDLEEARGPDLELAEQKGSDAPAPPPVEELEVALPGPNVGGGYDDSLMPPPEAHDELQAHLRRQEDDIPPPPESLAQYPSVQPDAPPAEIVPIYDAAPAAPAAPEVIARPIPVGSPEAFGNVRDSFRPSSFVELLDASLALSGE